ncbi:uncharacterized protein TM35_000431230 [Trypanosoma theileri]|uniref:Attractin/MKLN-like beta-propeller domain-containing protein n=1 Tax=Trypanosoma theileri TaxID=67003 RepID=A0A1X0NIK1_9TRYP|nr:uncharacterized protein TM35_000431230 [Trypanosoma theileri]ORC84555.1 hypothetical protein TM35_000431230 [Trypanosoma theileri]
MGTDQIEGLLESPVETTVGEVAKGVPIASYRLRCRRLKCSSHNFCCSEENSNRDDNIFSFAIDGNEEEEGQETTAALEESSHLCPAARYGHSLTEIQSDVLFLFGGVSKNREYLNDAWILQLRDAEVVSTQMQVSGDVPSGRFGHSAHRCLNGESVIIFGGSNNTELYNEMYVVSVFPLLNHQHAVFRRISFSQLAVMPHQMRSMGNSISFLHNDHNSGSSSNRSVANYITNSYTTTTTNTTSTTRNSFLFSSSSSSWPSARRSHTLTPIPDGKAILFGGHAITSVNDVWLLDETTFEWKRKETSGINPHDPLSEMPAPRYCHSAVVYPPPTEGNIETSVERCLYVFGGVLFSRGGDNVLWELNLSSFVWRAVNVWGNFTPPARFGHTACILSQCMIIFGGTDKFPCGRTLDDCYIFKFPSLQWQPFHYAYSQRLTTSLFLSCNTSSRISSEDEDTLQRRRSMINHIHTALCCNHQQQQHQLLQGEEDLGNNCIPAGRRSHAAVQSSRGKIIIFGGWDGTRVDNDCFQLMLAPSTLREWSYDFLVSARRFNC